MTYHVSFTSDFTNGFFEAKDIERWAPIIAKWDGKDIRFEDILILQADLPEHNKDIIIGETDVEVYNYYRE